jgi:hypothetical protein
MRKEVVKEHIYVMTCLYLGEEVEEHVYIMTSFDLGEK